MCWGSNRGVALDAVVYFQNLGKRVSLMHFKQVWPLPGERLRKLLLGYKELIMVENNATGQFARVLSAETGVEISRRILKYDGKPFLFEDLLDPLKKILATAPKKKAPAKRRARARARIKKRRTKK